MRQAFERNGKLVVKFDYDKFILQALSPIRKKEYKAARREWIISLGSDNLEEVLEFLRDQGFEILESGEELIQSIKNLAIQQEQNLVLSRAQESNFQVFGLKKELREFQRAGVEYAVINKRVLIGDEQGLGKTIEAIGTVQSTYELPCLVVCLNTLIPNWVREFNSWTSFKVKPLFFDSKFDKNFDVLVLNYNSVKKFFNQLVEVEWKTVVIDESHYLKNFTSQRTSYIQKLVSKTKPTYILELTGTPSLNRPSELLPQLQILGVLDRDFGGWFSYVIRYCGAFRDRFGWNISGATHLDELHEKLRRSCYLRREKKDVLRQLPEKQYQVIEMELSNRREYQEAESQFLLYIEKMVLNQIKLSGVSLVDTVSKEELNRLKESQVLQALKKVQKAEQLVKLNYLRKLSVMGKLESIVEWVENFLESGEKLVLFGVHTVVINLLSEYFQCNKITGEVKVEDRQKYVDDFQTNPNSKLLILNIEAGGVGLTLTSASHVGFLELPWRWSDFEQCCDRLHRIGQENSVNVYSFIGKDTVDEWIYDLIQSKKEITSQVNEGVRKEKKLYKSIIESLTYD